MSVGVINSAKIIDPMIFKNKLKFVVDEKVNKQIVNAENNEFVRDVPPKQTSQILRKLYG